jgi:hypothetical protein
LSVFVLFYHCFVFLFFFKRRWNMLLDTQRARELAEASAKMIGQGQAFERTRRITGYLVGTLDRFNNAKRAEERDRVRHGV